MKRLLLVPLMVLVTLVGMVVFSQASDTVSGLQASANSASDAISILQATGNAGVPVKPKMYYLTTKYFDGVDATTACDSGFHMASLSEIQDPSSVQYAPRRTPAYDSPYDSPPYDSPPSDQSSDQFPDHTRWVRRIPHG